jgi:hypothetical protein
MTGIEVKNVEVVIALALVNQNTLHFIVTEETKEIDLFKIVRN